MINIYIWPFDIVEFFFIQVNVFIRPGPLLVGAIPPVNSGSGRIKTIPWMNKVSACRKVLLLSSSSAVDLNLHWLYHGLLEYPDVQLPFDAKSRPGGY